MSADRDCGIRETDGPSPGGPIDSRLVLLSFSVLYGLIAAALSGYFYGLVDHPPHLALIFRAMDPGYLTNDFFVNAASGFGPRFYYSHMLAFLAGYVPLHIVVAVIWLSTFVAVTLITAFAARDITGSLHRSYCLQSGRESEVNRSARRRRQSQVFWSIPRLDLKQPALPWQQQQRTVFTVGGFDLIWLLFNGDD